MLSGLTVEELPPHVQRMVEEQEQLGTRYHALREFINRNPLYAMLEAEERIDMFEQSIAMGSYLVRLERRISRATRNVKAAREDYDAGGKA